MRSASAYLLSVIGLALSSIGFQQAQPDLSSPKATVRSFLKAVKERNTATIQQCLKGALKPEVLQFLFTDPDSLIIVSVDNVIAEAESNTAHVAAEIILAVPAYRDMKTPLVAIKHVEMFILVKQGSRWLLTPDPDITKFAPGETSVFEQLAEKRPLALAVTFATTPGLEAMVRSAHNKSLEYRCKSNIRQVLLGVIMYTQDHNERLPPKESTYTDMIEPYLKNKLLSTCPLEPKGTFSYAFNSDLVGKMLTRIPVPARTVMLYEGKAGKLTYRHDGKAMVGFADGHVKEIGPEEADGLIWNVQVPNPAVGKPVQK